MFNNRKKFHKFISILDQVVSEIKDYPLEAVMTAGLLAVIVDHKIYKNERKCDPTLACFLNHVSAQKQQPVPIAQVVKRVENI